MVRSYNRLGAGVDEKQKKFILQYGLLLRCEKLLVADISSSLENFLRFGRTGYHKEESEHIHIHIGYERDRPAVVLDVLESNHLNVLHI